MKKVDIIFPGNINATIGPVGTLKRMLADRDYFQSRGYDITVFTYDTVQRGGIKRPPTVKSEREAFRQDSLQWKIKQRVKGIILNKAKIHPIVAKLWLERGNHLVKRLIKNYISLNRHVDIVQFHGDDEPYYYMLHRKVRSEKVAVFMHADGIPFRMTVEYFPCLKDSKYIQKKMKQLEWTIYNADHYNFIAKIGKINTMKFFPQLKEENTSVIINGIDDLKEEQLAEIEKIRETMKSSVFKYRMCCTGSVNVRKGQRLIIEALNKLPEKLQKQIHVDILGEGAERHPLQLLVKKYALEDNVEFHGLVPNIEVYKYLARNNIYVLMSYNEGLPISIIEAMRASLMVISTNVSGIPEIVETGLNGFLLNPNADELAECLKELPNIDIEALGKCSRKRYENELTFKRMESDFCDMYDNLLTKKS